MCSSLTTVEQCQDIVPLNALVFTEDSIANELKPWAQESDHSVTKQYGTQLHEPVPESSLCKWGY